MKLNSCEKIVLMVSLFIITIIIVGVVAYVEHNSGQIVAPDDMWYNGGTRDLL